MSGEERQPGERWWKSGCVRVIEREEVRGDDPVEYVLPTGVGSAS